MTDCTCSRYDMIHIETPECTVYALQQTVRRYGDQINAISKQRDLAIFAVGAAFENPHRAIRALQLLKECSTPTDPPIPTAEEIVKKYGIK